MACGNANTTEKNVQNILGDRSYPWQVLNTTVSRRAPSVQFPSSTSLDHVGEGHWSPHSWAYAFLIPNCSMCSAAPSSLVKDRVKEGIKASQSEILIQGLLLPGEVE